MIGAVAMIVLCVTAVVLCIIVCTTVIVCSIPTDIFGDPDDRGNNGTE